MKALHDTHRKPSGLCDCAGCRGIPTADPKYGYDRAEVPNTECIACGQKIGDLPYKEVTPLARFGQMFFTHYQCPTRRP